MNNPSIGATRRKLKKEKSVKTGSIEAKNIHSSKTVTVYGKKYKIDYVIEKPLKPGEGPALFIEINGKRYTKGNLSNYLKDPEWTTKQYVEVLRDGAYKLF